MLRHLSYDVGPGLTGPDDQHPLAGYLRRPAVLRAMQQYSRERLLPRNVRQMWVLMEARADSDGVVVLLMGAASIERSHRPLALWASRYRLDSGAETDVPPYVERFAIVPKIVNVLAHRHVASPVGRHREVREGGEQA